MCGLWQSEPSAFFCDKRARIFPTRSLNDYAIEDDEDFRVRLGVSRAIDDIFLSTRTDTNVRKKRREINRLPFVSSSTIARKNAPAFLIRVASHDRYCDATLEIRAGNLDGGKFARRPACMPRDWGIIPSCKHR